MYRLFVLLLLIVNIKATTQTVTMAMPVNYIDLSQKFVYSARTGEDVEEYLIKLKNADEKLLKQQLTGDDSKKAFWINVYNAYTQVILRKDPNRYNNRNNFFQQNNLKSQRVGLASMI